MMIDWSSSILLSSQITFHMLFLEIHLWLYRTDIGLIAAHIACQTVKITPFCWIHGRRRGIMLIALILIRLRPSPYILVVGDFSRWLLHCSLILHTPLSVPSCSQFTDYDTLCIQRTKEWHLFAVNFFKYIWSLHHENRKFPWKFQFLQSSSLGINRLKHSECFYLTKLKSVGERGPNDISWIHWESRHKLLTRITNSK